MKRRRRRKGALVRSVIKKRGPRVRFMGDFSNLGKSGRIAARGDDGWSVVKWDDGTTSRVPTAIFSTPRWRVG